MKIKKVLFIFLSFIIVITLLSPLAGLIAYNKLFSRTERPNYELTPGLVDYSIVNSNNDYSRELYSINSNKETLQGYYYPVENSQAMIVMSHGINDGADGLLPQIMYFIDKGYTVFSYDGTGCYSSSGKSSNGFSQSLIDLENVLHFIDSTPTFASQKKLLFGYSWGGYASTSIFNLDTNNIYGSVSISGYYDAKNLLYNKGKSYVGPLATLGKPFLDILLESRFKDYLSYDAIAGINNTSLPIYIIHGEKDATITYNNLSIISQKDRITNPNVIYQTILNKGHVTLMYSNDSIEYRKKVDKELKELKKKEHKAYIAQVDDVLYSQIDKELFDNIDLFYKNCL